MTCPRPIEKIPSWRLRDALSVALAIPAHADDFCEPDTLPDFSAVSLPKVMGAKLMLNVVFDKNYGRGWSYETYHHRLLVGERYEITLDVESLESIEEANIDIRNIIFIFNGAGLSNVRRSFSYDYNNKYRFEDVVPTEPGELHVTIELNFNINLMKENCSFEELEMKLPENSSDAPVFIISVSETPCMIKLSKHYGYEESETRM